MKKYAIGIDIGGTKISVVIGTIRGRILAKRVIPTRIKEETEACVHELKKTIRAVIKEAAVKKSEIYGIGLGMPGAVDGAKGVAPRSPHLKGWEGMPIRQILKAAFRLPVTMNNDANAAALAEKIFGACKFTRHFIYVTVSTGVGGGIVVNRELLTGASFVAGEIGHMVIETKGEKWKMREIGVLEAYASGTAMARWLEREIRARKGKHLKDYRDENGKITALRAAEKAKEGDALALKAFKRGGHYLGIGLANLLNIINPEKIVLGGGVFRSSPPEFWDAMMVSCKERSWEEAFNAVEITRSRLKNNVGDFGSLALAFNETLAT